MSPGVWAVAADLSAAQALEAGFYPFLVGGAVKAAIAAGVLSGLWRSVSAR